MSKFKTGDEVEVISLGRKVHVGFTKHNDLVKCRWVDNNYGMHHDTYHPDELKLVVEEEKLSGEEQYKKLFR